jgi:hypothetical protein
MKPRSLRIRRWIPIAKSPSFLGVPEFCDRDITRFD